MICLRRREQKNIVTGSNKEESLFSKLQGRMDWDATNAKTLHSAWLADALLLRTSSGTGTNKNGKKWPKWRVGKMTKIKLEGDAGKRGKSVIFSLIKVIITINYFSFLFCTWTLGKGPMGQSPMWSVGFWRSIVAWSRDTSDWKG